MSTKAAESRKPAIRFFHKATCSTCRRARHLLEGAGANLELRDLGKQRLSAKEIDALIGDRDYRKFLNPRNEVYRRRKMGKNPPTRAEALRLMAAEPNLIRRPVVVCGSEIIAGFDEEALRRAAAL